MASRNHELYFERRERHCRMLAETHDDPALRRVYWKFAENYAKALHETEPGPKPSRQRSDSRNLITAGQGRSKVA